jgi:hypothetical protein
MSAPATSIRNIGTSNPNGLTQTPVVDMSLSDMNGRPIIPPKVANYTFGAGVIVFIVLFSGTWILLISFAPGMILVDDHNNKGSKIISYGLTIMWSFLISLILIALSSVSLWFTY